MKVATIIAALAACLVLAVAGTALASTPTQDAYGGTAGQQVGGSSGSAPSASATAPSTSGSLPFTGGDLLLIGVAGAALVGTGVAIRRASRHSA